MIRNRLPLGKTACIPLRSVPCLHHHDMSTFKALGARLMPL